MTDSERIERLERIVVALARDVAPGTMNGRAARREDIVALTAELDA